MKDLPEEKNSIPTSKVARASKVITTGIKVGGNYLKHYSKQLIGAETSQEQLDQQNADVIFDALGEMKGSALKAAQMMSMDTHVLPKAFMEKFTMAQYSAPPLSGPLVNKTFKNELGKLPSEIYDQFNPKASFAASIGQVHEASLNGKRLAIKIQYPGVADSVKSDIKLLKPIALSFLKLSESETKIYFEEVEEMLLNETNYDLELSNAQQIAAACSVLKHVVFPTYYKELSSKKVLTMDWLEGEHLDVFMQQNTDQALANQIGQALWDFYNFQIHRLQQTHADPHPGNFLVTTNGDLGVLDFGCVKSFPADFHRLYFSFLKPGLIENEPEFVAYLKALNVLRDDDTPEEFKFFLNYSYQVMELLTQPYFNAEFDFSDPAFFKRTYEMGERIMRDAQSSNMMSARGSKHFIYLNRTFFGLYSILHQLKAKIHRGDYLPTYA